MSMVAVYKASCCGIEFSYGRFIPPEDAMKRPETNCPSCGKRIVLHYSMGRYVEEHRYGVKHPHKYIIPKKTVEALF